MSCKSTNILLGKKNLEKKGKMVNFEFWCHKFIIARSAPSEILWPVMTTPSVFTRPALGYFKLCSKIDTIYFNPIRGGLFF